MVTHCPVQIRTFGLRAGLLVVRFSTTDQSPPARALWPLSGCQNNLEEDFGEQLFSRLTIQLR